MSRIPDDPEAEAARATELLVGKTVRIVRRHNERMILIEFTDRTRLFVDSKATLELSITGTGEPTHRCPCCSCKTLGARGGFELCPVCWWEDDGQDESDVDLVRGGPNGSLSLRAARENYHSCGASDPAFVHRVRKPKQEEL